MGLPQAQLVKNLSVYFRMNGRNTLIKGITSISTYTYARCLCIPFFESSFPSSNCLLCLQFIQSIPSTACFFHKQVLGVNPLAYVYVEILVIP
jgi:hypothetical protein